MNSYTTKQEATSSNYNIPTLMQYQYLVPTYPYLNAGGMMNISDKPYSTEEANTAKYKAKREISETGMNERIGPDMKPDISNASTLIPDVKPDIPDRNDSLYVTKQEKYIIMCDVCDFQSTSHREMDVHRLSHGLKRNEAMSGFFDNGSEYQNMDPDISKVKKEHACDECPYSAKTRQQLISHKKSHSLEKAYSCSQCSYKCKYLSGFRYHEMSHTNLKLFKCDECNFNCMTAGLLKSHKRRHSDVAPYACRLCSYRCKYPAGLRYHLITHTKGKDIACSLCNYVCRTPSELKIHSKKHDARSETCEFCGYSCKSKKTMTQHKISCKFHGTLS